MRQIKSYFTSALAALITVSCFQLHPETAVAAPSPRAVEEVLDQVLSARYLGNGIIEIFEKQSGRVVKTIQTSAGSRVSLVTTAGKTVLKNKATDEVIEEIITSQQAAPSKLKSILTATKDKTKRTGKRVGSIAYDKLVHFPIESVGFYIALMAISWVHMTADYSSNPTAISQLNNSQMTLGSQAGFYFFMLGNGLATAPLVDMIKDGKINPKRMPFINMFGMSVGSVFSSIFNELHSWPGGGFTNLVACAKNNFVGEEPKSGDTCDQAYQAWIEKEKLPGMANQMAPSLMALVATIAINGTLQTLATKAVEPTTQLVSKAASKIGQGALDIGDKAVGSFTRKIANPFKIRQIWTAGRLSLEIRMSKSAALALAEQPIRYLGIALPIAAIPGGALITRVGTIALNAVFFLGTQETIEPIITNAYTNFDISGDFNNLETFLINDLQQSRIGNWRDANKNTQLEERLKLFSKRMMQWRTNELSKTLTTQSAWTEKIGKFSKTYSEAKSFYSNYMNKMHERYYSSYANAYNSGIATHVIQESMPLDGINPSPKKIKLQGNEEEVLYNQQFQLAQAQIFTLRESALQLLMLTDSLGLSKIIPEKQNKDLQNILNTFLTSRNMAEIKFSLKNFVELLSYSIQHNQKTKTNIVMSYQYENYLNEIYKQLFSVIINSQESYLNQLETYLNKNIKEENQKITLYQTIVSDRQTQNQIKSNLSKNIIKDAQLSFADFFKTHESLYKILSVEEQANVLKILSLISTPNAENFSNALLSTVSNLGLKGDDQHLSALTQTLLLVLQAKVGTPTGGSLPGMNYLNYYESLTQSLEKTPELLEYKRRWNSDSTASIHTDSFTESMIAAMIFGPNAEKKQSSIAFDSVVLDPIGFPARFIAPQVLDNSVQFQLPPQTAAVIPTIFNTPVLLQSPQIAADKKSYSQFNNLYDFLTAGLVKKNIFPQNENNFENWWQENIESQYIKSWTQYESLYQQNIARVVETFNAADSKFNRSDMPNAYLPSILIDAKINLMFAGEIVRDIVQQPGYEVLYKGKSTNYNAIDVRNLETQLPSNRSPRHKKLIRYLRQNNLMNITAFKDQYFHGKDATPEKYRHPEFANLEFQEKIFRKFEALTKMLTEKIKVRSMKALNDNAKYESSQCEKLRTDKNNPDTEKVCVLAPVTTLENDAITKAADDIRNEIKAFTELALGAAATIQTADSSQNKQSGKEVATDTKSKNAKLSDYLNPGQAKIISTAMNNLSNIVNDLEGIAKSINLVSYRENHNQKGTFENSRCNESMDALKNQISGSMAVRSQLNAALEKGCEMKEASK